MLCWPSTLRSCEKMSDFLGSMFHELTKTLNREKTCTPVAKDANRFQAQTQHIFTDFLHTPHHKRKLWCVLELGAVLLVAGWLRTAVASKR